MTRPRVETGLDRLVVSERFGRLAERMQRVGVIANPTSVDAADPIHVADHLRFDRRR